MCMSIAHLIRYQRKHKQLTQMQLAVQSGLSLPTIQNLEGGRAGNPTFDVLEKIGKVLELRLALESLEPDWRFLIEFGLPLGQEKKQKPETSFSSLRFLEECQKAMRYLLKYKVPESDRRFEAVAALLDALQRHYPQYLLYCFDQSLVKEFMKNIKRDGRMIKLSRIALSKISKVL